MFCGFIQIELIYLLHIKLGTELNVIQHLKVSAFR